MPRVSNGIIIIIIIKIILWINCTSFSKQVGPVWLILSVVAGGSFKSLLTRRCKTLCLAKPNSTRSLQSHQCLNGFFLTESLLLLFHFCVFLSQLPELVWKLTEEISLQSASKRFPSFGPPANGNEINAKNSRFLPNRNLTGKIYHWSVILRSFSVLLNSAKRDAIGFFKVLLLSSHLLISRHPVRKWKFGACAVTGYCPLSHFAKACNPCWICYFYYICYFFYTFLTAVSFKSFFAKGAKTIC